MTESACVGQRTAVDITVENRCPLWAFKALAATLGTVTVEEIDIHCTLSIDRAMVAPQSRKMTTEPTKQEI